MNRFTTTLSFKFIVAGCLLAGAIGLGMSDPAATGTPGTSPTTSDPSVSPTDKTVDPTDKTLINEMPQPTAGQLPPNVGPGWKIRVCSEKTKADSIRFQLSQGEKMTLKMGKSKSNEAAAAQSQEIAVWTRGDSTIIPVPADLRDVDRLRIEAVPGQKNQKSSVCLIYNDHVAKKLNFDDREVSTVKQTENGECGC